MKADYKFGDQIFILENPISTTGKLNKGKILTVFENRKNSGYLLTTEPNCSGVWHHEIRLATEEDLICNNYSIL